LKVYGKNYIFLLIRNVVRISEPALTRLAKLMPPSIKREAQMLLKKLLLERVHLPPLYMLLDL